MGARNSQERLEPKHGPVQIGRISNDKKIIKEVSKVVSLLNLNFIVNIEMKYPDHGVDKIPLIYEINPRPSAAIICAEEAGVNMLDDAIRLHKGGDVFSSIPLPITMYRYWNEYFC